MRKKTVSYSQFANYWSCPARWKLDYIDKLKTFEDSIHMSFGTSIHEAIQHYLHTLYNIGEKEAEAVDMIPMFIAAFKREVTKKNLKYTPEEFAEFTEDGKAILTEFKDPANRRMYFPRDKWELLGIEMQIDEPVINNVNLTAKLDLVLREKQSGDIRIIDIKTATNAWNNYQKSDFSKISQLILYKAVYSKKYKVPLNKIHVEFFILKRKLYDNCNYEQSRIQIFKPSTYQQDILQVIREFRKFVEDCFTPQGDHNTSIKYNKIPNGGKNCKWCIYAKNGKCDQIPDIIEK
jgi:hypothetical protein